MHCPKEYQEGPIEPKEFFVFHKTNLVWCNVFKSASTRFVKFSNFTDLPIHDISTIFVSTLSSLRRVELGFFFIFLGEKTWSWEFFFKKNKKNSTLVKEFRVRRKKRIWCNIFSTQPVHTRFDDFVSK